MSPGTDLRARKKLATHRALATAARELTLEHGLENVTVETITEQAGVSPRTFFNYFSCKEEAIVGVEPTMLGALRRAVEERPACEEPPAALAAVLIAHADSDLARLWTLFAELTRRHPELIPRHLAGIIEVERALTAAIATRMGVEPDADPRPRLVVACAMATVRSTLEWWHENERPVTLRRALTDAFETLCSGLPGPGFSLVGGTGC